MSRTPLELKSEILRAGAGAGKTTRLVEEFVRVYDHFKKETQQTPRIIVTTFTRKATHELKERLLQKALERQDKELFHFISQKSRVHISTIHGVLALFLRQQGFHIGLSPDFKLISENEDLKLRKKILKKVLLQNPEFLHLFEDYKVSELLEAVEMASLSFLLDPKIEPIDRRTMESDCAALFSERINELLGWAKKIENENPPEAWLQYLQQFRRLKQIDWKDFFAAFNEIKNTLESAGAKPRFSKTKPAFNCELNEAWDEKIKELKKILKDTFYNPEIWQKWFATQKVFRDLAQMFLKEVVDQKIKTSQLRMSDLELMSAVVLKNKPETGVYFSMDWNYWMIDEYQDTSPLQVYLLKNLIQDRPQFIVGDPQQSIYLFRGARSEVFEEKLQEFSKNQSVISEKLDNYRSRAPVLHLINDVFVKMSSQFKPMIAKKDWDSPFVPCEILIADSTAEDKEEKEKLELSLVLHKISELLQSGVAAEKIAVLSRTNRRLEQLGLLAKTHGISYQQPNAAGYFLKREIKDAASILKFLLNPHDNDHLVACLRSPWFFMNDKDLVSSCQKKSYSLWKTLLSFQKANAFAEKSSEDVVKKLLSYLEQAQHKGISQTLIDILVERGLFDISESIDPSGRREANLWKFVNTIKEKERTSGFHYIEFLNEVEALIKSEDEGEAVPVIEPQRVNFMTVHASKGLQFDHLILTGLSQDQKKSSSLLWSMNEKRNSWSLALREAEEQSWVYSPQTREQTLIQQEKENLESERVFYVAVTRAKDSVTLVMNSDIKNQSWAQKLFLNFTEGEHFAEGYSYRVKKFSSLPEIRNVARLETAVAKQESPQKFLVIKNENIKSSSVTSLLDRVGSQTAETVNTFELIKKSQFGTDLHRVFESMKYLSFKQVSLLYKTQNLQDTLNYIHNLKAPPMLSLIEKGFVEYGFEVLRSGQIIKGQIDLWAKLGNEVWIIDYKTGSTQYVEKAFQQLNIYAQALQLIHQWKNDIKIHLSVLYPIQEQVFTRPAEDKVEL